MKTFAAAALSALVLTLPVMTTPAQAQTLGTLLPTLTWPEGDVTSSTKGCDGSVTTVCTQGK